jgi:hypothetical protein
VRREARRSFAAGIDEADAAIEIRLGWFDKWVEPERLVHNVMRSRRLRGDPSRRSTSRNCAPRWSGSTRVGN